jgi:hypothetical protein
MCAGTLQIATYCQLVTDNFPKTRNREFKSQNRELIRRIRELPRTLNAPLTAYRWISFIKRDFVYPAAGNLGAARRDRG